MLVFREDQMRSVGQRHFEREMADHLHGFSRPLCDTLAQAELVRVIRFGMNAAAGYGFTLRGPVRLYLETMLLFGSHFPSDPQYPWLLEALAGKQEGDQMERARVLYQRIVAYRKAVNGPEDAFSLAALRRIQWTTKEPLPLREASFASDARQLMARIYPQKATFLGTAALDALIDRSVRAARAQEFPGVRGAALVLMLMLTFGHGCGDDPLYPWINRTLAREPPDSGEARALRLERRALTWLEHVLENLADQATP